MPVYISTQWSIIRFWLYFFLHCKPNSREISWIILVYRVHNVLSLYDQFKNLIVDKLKARFGDFFSVVLFSSTEWTKYAKMPKYSVEFDRVVTSQFNRPNSTEVSPKCLLRSGAIWFSGSSSWLEWSVYSILIADLIKICINKQSLLVIITHYKKQIK